MSNGFRSLIACLLATLGAGCAYVEYRRVYSVEPKLSAEQRADVGTSIERYFIGKGYVLRQKFHDYFPDDMYVSVLEIPHEPKRKVRDPRLFILAKQTGSVQLKHSEWFLDNAPFGESRHKPKDIVSLAREELIQSVRREVGVTIDVQFSEKGYY